MRRKPQPLHEALAREIDREADDRFKARAQDFAKRTVTMRLLSNPLYQHDAREILRRYPQARALANKGDTAGHVLLRLTQRLADPERLDENLRALGLPANGTRADLAARIAQLAPELGKTGREVEHGFKLVEQVEMQDRLTMELFKQEQRHQHGDPDELTDEQRAKRTQEEDLRKQIEGLYDQGEQEATRRAGGSELYKAPSSLHADIERAFEAHHGRHPRVDPESYGARQWVEEHTDMPEARHNQRAHFARIRADAQAEAFEDEASNFLRQDSPRAAESLAAEVEGPAQTEGPGNGN